MFAGCVCSSKLDFAVYLMIAVLARSRCSSSLSEIARAAHLPNYTDQRSGYKCVAQISHSSGNRRLRKHARELQLCASQGIAGRFDIDIPLDM